MPINHKSEATQPQVRGNSTVSPRWRCSRISREFDRKLGAKLNGNMLRASTDDNYIELGWYERLIVDAWPYDADQP